MQPAFWNSSADIGPLEFSKSLLALFPKILKTDSHLITGSKLDDRESFNMINL